MYPNESCRSVECDRCMFTRRGTVIRTSSGRTSACLRGRVRMHSSRESAGAQRARGFRTCVFERANQLERRSPTTPCPNRRTCSWTRVRFTRKLYGMIPKPLARTSAAGGRVLELAERLDTVEGPLRRAAFSHYEILDDSTDVRVTGRIKNVSTSWQRNFRGKSLRSVHRWGPQHGAPRASRTPGSA